jgi:hypothetical protein
MFLTVILPRRCECLVPAMVIQKENRLPPESRTWYVLDCHSTPSLRVSGTSEGYPKGKQAPPPPRFYLTGFRPRQEESHFYESTGDGLMILEWFWTPDFRLLCKKDSESDQESERTKRANTTTTTTHVSLSCVKPGKHNNNTHHHGAARSRANRATTTTQPF